MAKDTGKYLYNENMINNHIEWGEKRKFRVRNDFFFDVENIDGALINMIEENPGNKLAFEYLMAIYMINKDLRSFVDFFPKVEKLNYKEVPVAYQEALIYIILLNKRNPFPNAHQYVNESIKSRMRSYVEIYTKYPDAMVRLRKNYWNTYWYYLHFSEFENTILKKPNP